MRIFCDYRALPLSLRRVGPKTTLAMTRWPAPPVPPRRDRETAASQNESSLARFTPARSKIGSTSGCEAGVAQLQGTGRERRVARGTLNPGRHIAVNPPARTRWPPDWRRDRVAAQAFHSSGGPWCAPRLQWLRPPPVDASCRRSRFHVLQHSCGRFALGNSRLRIRRALTSTRFRAPQGCR